MSEEPGHKREPEKPDTAAAVDQGPFPGNGHEDSGDPAGVDAGVKGLQAELEAAKTQAAENHDKFLRARADIENARRRTEIDLANAHKYAIERFATELLAVRDSLELARTVDIQREDQTALQKMHEGLDLTLKLMDDTFRKFNLSMIDPKGARFDPEKHHAISLVESAEVPPNHVVSVMQKGCLLHDRLLRPAMVVVARAPQAASAGDSAPNP